MNAISSTDFHDRISSLKFARRKESWVAAFSGRFYKIFRKSNDPLRDLLDPECMERALREYTDMRFLHDLSDGVCCPEHIEHGCVVYPYLSGPDMRDLLRSHATRKQRDSCLRDAICLLAQLHAGAGDAREYPNQDYLQRSCLTPSTDITERIATRTRTLVIGGFEVRNLRFDKSRGIWRFFDPQHVWRGVPENDFARFIVSLLMVNWGSDGSLRCWDDFDMDELLTSYEYVASTSLDKKLLNFFLREMAAMRKFSAEKTLRKMTPARQIFGWPYNTLYFYQIEKWSSAHEV